MNISEAQAELSALRRQLEESLNDFHKRTGLIVNVYIHHTDMTQFGSERRTVIHSVEIEGFVKDGSA